MTLKLSASEYTRGRRIAGIYLHLDDEQVGGMAVPIEQADALVNLLNAAEELLLACAKTDAALAVAVETLSVRGVACPEILELLGKHVRAALAKAEPTT